MDAFRIAIGSAKNGNAPGPFPNGRREINWDGGGAAAAVLLDMLKDTYENNRDAVFGTAINKGGLRSKNAVSMSG